MRQSVLLVLAYACAAYAQGVPGPCDHCAGAGILTNWPMDTTDNGLTYTSSTINIGYYTGCGKVGTALSGGGTLQCAPVTDSVACMASFPTNGGYYANPEFRAQPATSFGSSCIAGKIFESPAGGAPNFAVTTTTTNGVPASTPYQTNLDYSSCYNLDHYAVDPDACTLSGNCVSKTTASASEGWSYCLRASGRAPRAPSCLRAAARRPGDLCRRAGSGGSAAGRQFMEGAASGTAGEKS